MENKVFIVIPVHNRLKYTKRCLASLSTQSYKNFEVIVVDDGSSDNTNKYIREKYPYWTVINGNGEWWWTRSVYKGVAYSLKYSKPEDYVLLLNNDCYAKRNYLENIVKASQKNKRAIIGSLVVDADNPNRVIESGIRIDWETSHIYGVSDTVSDKFYFYQKRVTIKDLDTLPGKGTLIPIEVFKKIGNFNYRRLPHYVGDYEFFCRAKRNGLNLLVSTKSILYNYAKATGTEHLEGLYSSYKKIFNAMFGRKSKINILDYANFILLCCPKKYLKNNLKILANRLLYYIVNMYPFCYIPILIKQIKIQNYKNLIRLKQLNKRLMGIYECKICGGLTHRRYENLYDNRLGYPKKFSIFKCFDCGFMQTEPQLRPAELSSIYTKYYPKRDANISDIINNSEKIPSKSEIAKNGWETTCHYQTKKGQKVLDIGCGTCQSLLEIKKLGGKAWGIDPDRNSERVAKHLKLKFHRGTIHNSPFPKIFFDLITVSQVIEHEPYPEKFLKNCKEYLKPRGKIILSFPSTNALGLKIWGRRWLHWHIPYHLNHFNKKSFELLVKKSGLKIKSIRTVTPNLWTILQIKSYINNVQLGERDDLWDDQKNTPKTKDHLIKRTATRSTSLITKTLFLNRSIDKLGLGASFVVVLKK